MYRRRRREAACTAYGATPRHCRVQLQARRAALAAAIAGLLACGGGDSAPPAARPAATARPSVLWIVWDTVRADRLSLYGHSRKTTPNLDGWAKRALVFEDAISAAGYTVPSHASMFTGLLPSEHCANGDATSLREDFDTLAEILRDEGYATFLYSENPHLSEHRAFAQGFDRVEHPWSEDHYDAALAILRRKTEGDTSSELGDRLARMESGDVALTPWNLKAAGELAEHAVLRFLEDDATDYPTRPFFAFVNYMEAHRPTIPPREHREEFMSAADVEASYHVDRSWPRIWEYTFGHTELSEQELELTRATYDAAIHELDALLGSLLASLDERGYLENTVVVLTADHGEQLGEQHMFDHQSTLYDPVLRVPLVLYHPQLVAAGRRSEPVMNFDLFPTLLELTKSPAPPRASSMARSLLAEELPADRQRLAEETATESAGVRAMRELHPGWDATPWLRSQRAVYSGRYKWIWSSSGEHALFDLNADPQETRNVARLREIDAAAMNAALQQLDAGLAHCEHGAAGPELSDEERQRLETLGYLPPQARATTPVPDGSRGSDPRASQPPGKDDGGEGTSAAAQVGTE